MRSIFCFSSALVALGIVLSGCADLLGIEPWEEPSGNGSPDPTLDTDAGPDGGACNDGVQNGFETGVDCGGVKCPACDLYHGCTSDSDCASKYCPPERGYCTTSEARAVCHPPDAPNPTCADCERNGDETDVDCGGTCAPCRAEKQCGNHADCMSGICSSGRCAAGEAGKDCYSNDDCVSGMCALGDCTTTFCCQ